MRNLFVAALAVLLLAGCATTTRTETRKMYNDVKTVAVGDDVLITTKDGRRLEFRVTAADAKNIQGKGIAVARADVATLKTVSLSTVTTQETSAQPAVQAISTLAIVYGVIVVVAIMAVF